MLTLMGQIQAHGYRGRHRTIITGYALKRGLTGSRSGIQTHDLKIVRCPLCHLSHRASVVLGVIFDQKLQWSDRVAHCIAKSNKALTAIRMIKRFFSTQELLQLITANFYSILYYNSEIWHLN